MITNLPCPSYLDAGPSTALKWYANGCRTLDDVKAGKGGIKLNPVQEIGIRFYDGEWIRLSLIVTHFNSYLHSLQTSMIACLATRHKRSLI